MGTPDFAVYSLKALFTEHEILAVVTQPDKPKGRGKKMLHTPIKEFSLQQDEAIPIYQPQKAREESFIEILKELEPDVIVVVAYGQILPKSILDIPKYGCINVHGSLLPEYRGAAPMQWSLMNGDEKTGITTMYMAEGMDTGDMILKREIPIEKKCTFALLHDRMAETGADLLLETLTQIENGTAPRTPQNESEATYAPRIQKEHERIDWSKSADEILNFMYGLDPTPATYTMYQDTILKCFQGEKLERDTNGIFGEVLEVGKEGIVVACKDGAVCVKEVQAQGKKRMSADAYLRGNPMELGVVLT